MNFASVEEEEEEEEEEEDLVTLKICAWYNREKS